MKKTSSKRQSLKFTAEVVDPVLQRLGRLRVANVLQRLVEQRVAGQLGALQHHLPQEEASSAADHLLQLNLITQGELNENAAAQSGGDAVIPEGGVSLGRGGRRKV